MTTYGSIAALLISGLHFATCAAGLASLSLASVLAVLWSTQKYSVKLVNIPERGVDAQGALSSEP